MTQTDTKQDRWDRLAADLAAVGIEARVDRKPYQQVRYGRMETGVSSSVTFQVRDGDRFQGVVHVSDKFGRGGKWYGWTVTAEGPDSITIGRPTWAQTKRSVTVTEFQQAVARVGA